MVINAELFEKIRLSVYSQQGWKLSIDDPVFTSVIATQLTMESYSAPIIEAIDRIPEILEGSLNVIASAVEEAENTSQALVSETKSLLVALAKVELEAAHRRITDTIDRSVESAVAVALKGVRDEVVSLESTLRFATDNLQPRKAFAANVILSTAIVVILVVFSTAGYVLYDIGVGNRKSADYWRTQYSQQQDVISTLPPTVKKLFGPQLQTE